MHLEMTSFLLCGTFALILYLPCVILQHCFASVEFKNLGWKSKTDEESNKIDSHFFPLFIYLFFPLRLSYCLLFEALWFVLEMKWKKLELWNNILRKNMETTNNNWKVLNEDKGWQKYPVSKCYLIQDSEK